MALSPVLFISKRGVIDSSRGKRSSRVGESGREGQLPEQWESERVRSRDVGPRLSRICDRSGRLRDDGFHFYGHNGQRGVALEGTGPWTSSHRPLQEPQPGTPLWAGS